MADYDFQYTHDSVEKTVTIVKVSLNIEMESIEYVLQITDQWGNSERIYCTCEQSQETFDFVTNKAALQADAASALDNHFA